MAASGWEFHVVLQYVWHLEVSRESYSTVVRVRDVLI